MVKHITALIVFSILIILFMPLFQQGLGYLVSIHDWIGETLKQVFSVGEAGDVIRQLLALLAVPVLVSLIPIMVYWLVKHVWFPWTLPLIWAIWLIETSAIILLYAPPPK